MHCHPPQIGNYSWGGGGGVVQITEKTAKGNVTRKKV